MDPKALNIIEKVETLYRRYGIKSVTMDEVALHLGISKKTIYGFFTDKADLVRHVMQYEHSRYCGYLDGIAKTDLNAIEELFEVYRIIKIMLSQFNPSMEYDIRKYYPEIFQQVLKTRRNKMAESVTANLRKGKKEGLYRKDLTPSIIAKLHVARTEILFYSDLFSQEEVHSPRFFHELFVYHVQGILSAEGRVFFENNFDRFKE